MVQPRFPQSHFHRGTWVSCLNFYNFKYKTFTFFGWRFHAILLSLKYKYAKSHNPPPKARFRLLRFRSPLLTESLLISFPPGTLMFHFPECPHTAKRCVAQLSLCWVSPFGNRRIKGYLAPPRRVSPPTASFLGSYHQRHPPFALKVWRNACLKLKKLQTSILTLIKSKSFLKFSKCQWTVRGSNPLPHVCKTCTLPIELTALVWY